MTKKSGFRTYNQITPYIWSKGVLKLQRRIKCGLFSRGKKTDQFASGEGGRRSYVMLQPENKLYPYLIFEEF